MPWYSWAALGLVLAIMLGGGAFFLLSIVLDPWWQKRQAGRR